MTEEQVAFGSRLRRERERRDLAITAIADSTKINHSLLEALERGDASRWPAGIYRRAFVREYATAIGLATETILSEFGQLFPESGAAPPVCIDPTEATGTLRLTLASETRLSVRFLPVAAAFLDVCLVLAIGASMSVMFSASGWTVTAIAAISYYSIATALVGSSPALWLSNSVRSRRAGTPAQAMPVRPSSRDLFHTIAMAARLDGWSGHNKAASKPLVEQVCPDGRPFGANLDTDRQSARWHHQLAAVGGGEFGRDAIEPDQTIHADILRERRNDASLEMSAPPS